MTRPWRGNMGGCIMHSLLTLSCYEPRIPNGSSCQALSNKGPLGLKHSQPPISVVKFGVSFNIDNIPSILTAVGPEWNRMRFTSWSILDLMVDLYWISGQHSQVFTLPSPPPTLQRDTGPKHRVLPIENLQTGSNKLDIKENNTKQKTKARCSTVHETV